jgi:DNA replication protein DnaC
LDENVPGAKRLAMFTERWIKAAALNKRDRGTWMVLAGPPGVGKTHALKAARRFLENHAIDLWHECLWSNPPSVLWATWSRVVALERDEWDDWLYDLRRASVIILDDVGSEVDKYKTGEPAERLRVALDIAEHRWMLISTNLMPGQWSTAFDRRVHSRLQPAVILEMIGSTDFRSNKRPENQ